MGVFRGDSMDDSNTNSGNTLSDGELTTILAEYIDSALNDEDGDTSEVRQDNFNRYWGKKTGDERDGKSSFVTREVLEAVEWAMPSLIRIFTGNQAVAEFVANAPEDEDQAKQETDIVNYHIQVEGNGFLLCHNWLKDILMNPNGYVSAQMNTEHTITERRLTGLVQQDMANLYAMPDIEILEASERFQVVEPYGEQQLFDVRIRETKQEQKLDIACLPADEVLIHQAHNSIDLSNCEFTCHRSQQTISDLVKRGFDPETLKAIGDTDDNTWNDERVNRLFYEEESPDRDDDQYGVNRRLWVHDISVLVDYDLDDIAERRRVIMVGDQILYNEADSYQPIVAAAAIVIPHKHICMSLVESVKDLQRLSTTITRQMLDNVYSQTDRRHYFNEDGLLPDNSTIDDYLDGRSTAIVVRGDPQAIVMPEQTTPIIQELLSVIDHTKEQTKLRTGVAPQLSLDPNTLQQSTAGAFNQALDQASQRLDMIVRVIAEVGFKPLMLNIHRLIRENINSPASVKIRGSWVNFDPSTWQDRTKMTVRVGLGFPDNSVKVQTLMTLLGVQKEALSFGLTDPYKIYNTLAQLVEAGDVGHAESAFIDPAEPVKDPVTGEPVIGPDGAPVPWQPPQPEPPPPDPNMVIAQGQVQNWQQDQQRKFADDQAKTDLERQKVASNAQLKAQELALREEELNIERTKLDDAHREFNERLSFEVEKALADYKLKASETELTDARTEQIQAQTDQISRPESLTRQKEDANE